MTSSQQQQFIIAMTADFYDSDGAPKFRDLGLSVLDGHEHIKHRVFDEPRPQIGPDQIGDAQGAIVLTPAVTADSVSQSENLLAVGRFGVGYDAVDVAACTEADVVVFITAGAVDRPVAEATVGWMIALAHNVLAKDRLVRTGQWDERSKYMGGELRDRTLGVVGLGGIAQATIELLRGFGMAQPLAFDPFVDATTADTLGARLVDLPTGSHRKRHRVRIGRVVEHPDRVPLVDHVGVAERGETHRAPTVRGIDQLGIGVSTRQRRHAGTSELVEVCPVADNAGFQADCIAQAGITLLREVGNAVCPFADEGSCNLVAHRRASR